MLLYKLMQVDASGIRESGDYEIVLGKVRQCRHVARHDTNVQSALAWRMTCCPGIRRPVDFALIDLESILLPRFIVELSRVGGRQSQP